METTIYPLYLQRADRVTVPKGLIRHHGIYWGPDINGQHWFMENHPSSGVRFIPSEQFLQGTPRHQIGIQRFIGNDWQRQQAIARAEAMWGQPYDLLFFNCEHYSGVVQSGKPESRQVQTSIAVALLTVPFLLLAAK